MAAYKTLLGLNTSKLAVSIHCSRGDDKMNKSEHWSISHLSSPVFSTFAWCSCVVPSPYSRPLLLMLINLVFSLASHPSGVLSRMPCLFAVHCAYFFLCSISWNCSLGHCSHIFTCPLSAIMYVFDPWGVTLLTYFARRLFCHRERLCFASDSHKSRCMLPFVFKATQYQLCPN